MDECDLDSPTICEDETSEDEASESSDANESIDYGTDDSIQSVDEESEDSNTMAWMGDTGSTSDESSEDEESDPSYPAPSASESEDDDTESIDSEIIGSNPVLESSTESESDEEGGSCLGACCHGGSYVEECIGQPCDLPIDYDYGSKSATVDPKSPIEISILVCDDGILIEDWVQEDYHDSYSSDTEPTESGSELDCAAGEVTWGTSVAIWENCVGEPCEKGRRIPLAREEDQTEKSSTWQELVCQDGTWALEWFEDSDTGSESGSGSIYNCYDGMVIGNDMHDTGEPWAHECIGLPCDESARRKTPSDQDRDYTGSVYWQELICIDGSWDYIHTDGWTGSGWTEDSPDADGLEDFSTDEICYELCARKTLGDNKVDGLPDGFPDLEDLLPTDPGAALQACLESCLGPLSFNDADGGSATDENSETGSNTEIFSTAETTTTTQWPFASTCCTTTEEFVTTLTPIATTTEDFATTTVSPSACDEERTHECPNNSFCVPADNFVTFTCQCEAGYFMSGNMCHKKAPEAETCPEDFKKDLFKMKLDGLTNPKYYLNKGSVMIQVESQVISRFRRGLNRLDFVT